MRDEVKVLQANALFYKAFNSCDLELMKAVWHNDKSVRCVHPGWDALKGFDLIIQSWENIFRSSEGLEIRLSNVEYVESESLFWVGCQENLFSMSLSGVQVSRVHTTNLFRNVEGQWKMVLHHASVLPGEPKDEKISLN